MKGIDISNYQGGIYLANPTANYDFAIVKATEGVNYKDKYLEDFTVQLTKLGKKMGFYHFARPDREATVDRMHNEARWFCRVIESAGLLGKGILVLDWEVQPLNRPDLAMAWMNKVYEITGVKPFIYCGESMLSSWKGHELLEVYPIWVASWKSSQAMNVGERIIGTAPSLDKVEWTIWQYSSKGRFPGWTGNIDLDYANMSPEEWDQWSKVNKTPTSSSNEPEGSEVLSPDMQWACNHGLFHGYSDGKMHPKDALTREQAASLLRRFSQTKSILNSMYGVFMSEYVDTDTVQE